MTMARARRASPVGIPQHIIQRGNNRQVCFADEADMKAYLAWLSEYASKYQVDIHAWVLMTNHVHLLCTPQADCAISSLMQALGRKYVRYFNYTYGRTGTLWEGRYKSCLVQDDYYLLAVHRYIELNPVRAGMVVDPADYVWSSYQCNGLGRSSELYTPHPFYFGLGDDVSSRQGNYRALFLNHFDGVMLNKIRSTVNRGLALGDGLFVEQVEQLTQQRLSPAKRGRPKKKR